MKVALTDALLISTTNTGQLWVGSTQRFSTMREMSRDWRAMAPSATEFLQAQNKVMQATPTGTKLVQACRCKTF